MPNAPFDRVRGKLGGRGQLAVYLKGGAGARVPRRGANLRPPMFSLILGGFFHEPGRGLAGVLAHMDRAEVLVEQVP